MGDTLFWCPMPVYYINPLDSVLFNIVAEDLDGQPVDTSLSNQGIGSDWMFYDDSIAPGVWDSRIFAASDFAVPYAANNWLEFGPITIPDSGATLTWTHAMPDNQRRDGYELRLSLTGMVNTMDFINAPTLWFADNDAATDGDTLNNGDTLYKQQIYFSGAQFAQTQLYFAFHHTAYDQYILMLDDIMIREGNTLDTIDTTTVPTFTPVVVKNNAVGIFPNPASSVVNVKIAAEKNSGGHFVIRNQTGKVVSDSDILGLREESIQLNTSKFPSGQYFYQYISNTNSENGILTIVH